jgi:hypothetical protein
MVWGDEIFWSSEQAHCVVFGSGLVPWKFQLGMRSWRLPGVIAGVTEFSRLTGDGPDYYIPVIALDFAALRQPQWFVACFGADGYSRHFSAGSPQPSSRWRPNWFISPLARSAS